MPQIIVDFRTAELIADGEEMTGSNALVRVVGSDVYLGDAAVTDTDGLLLKESDGIKTIPLDSGDRIFAICKSGAGTNEKQQVTVTATSGTFPLTFSGQTTAGIPFGATSADVRAALVALSNIGADDVAVTGAAGGPWTVEFTGALSETNVAQMTTSSAGLGGGSASVATTVPGVAGNAAVVHTLVG